jgi:uncharacterized membrane protein
MFKTLNKKIKKCDSYMTIKSRRLIKFLSPRWLLLMTLIALSSIKTNFLSLMNRFSFLRFVFMLGILVYILGNQMVTSDAAVDFVVHSYKDEGLDFLFFLIVFFILVWGFAYVERITIFDSVFEKYKHASGVLDIIDSRIKKSKKQLQKTISLNEDKGRFKKVSELSISKTDVYKLENESEITIVLSKELIGDITDKALHKIVMTKFKERGASIKYTWYSDNQALEDNVDTLMNKWFHHMQENDRFTLRDIWGSRKFNIVFKRITNADHVLLNDINIYHYKTRVRTEVVGFLNELVDDKKNDDSSMENSYLTHFTKLLIPNPSELVESIDRQSEELCDRRWKYFVIRKLKEANLTTLWGKI